MTYEYVDSSFVVLISIEEDLSFDHKILTEYKLK